MNETKNACHICNSKYEKVTCIKCGKYVCEEHAFENDGKVCCQMCINPYEEMLIEFFENPDQKLVDELILDLSKKFKEQQKKDKN
jgi:hypothetical protein